MYNQGVCTELEMKICFFRLSWRKVVEKLTKISKTDFSMECFTHDFLRDFAKNVKTWLFGGWLSTCHQIQAFERFYCNFLIS